MPSRENLLEDSSEFISEEKLAALIEEQKPIFEKGIREILDIKYSPNSEWKDEKLENINEFVEREVKFCKRVIRMFEQWGKEDNVLVLWDVDETIGKSYRNQANNGHYEWHFRPAFTFLAKYLGGNYPNIKNGMLSTGSIEYLDKISKDVEPFFSEDNLTSLAESQIRSSERDRIEKAAQEITGENRLFLTDGEALKIGTLFELQSNGINVKNIDDGESALVMGINGLQVRDLSPEL